MEQYTFGSNSNSTTRKIANFIKDNYPRIDFVLEEVDDKLSITCKFNSNYEKDYFHYCLCNELNVNEKGVFLI